MEEKTLDNYTNSDWKIKVRDEFMQYGILAAGVEE